MTSRRTSGRTTVAAATRPTASSSVATQPQQLQRRQQRRHVVVLPYSHKASTLGATSPASYAVAARRQRKSRVAAVRSRRRRRHQSGGGSETGAGGGGLRSLLSHLLDSVKGKATHGSGHPSQSPLRDSANGKDWVDSVEGVLDADDGDDIITSMWEEEEEAGGAAPLLPPLRAGQVLRDLPFFTQNGEVQFFSTHPSLLDEVFGLSHGQRVWFTLGAFAGQRASVVGARGGSLWVLLDTESIAQELLLPPCYAAAPSTAGDVLPLSPETGEEVEEFTDATQVAARGGGGGGPAVAAVLLVRRALQRRYGLHILPSTDDDALPAELLQAADTQAVRLFTPEQRAFLQCAPDLFVSVVHEVNNEDDGGEARGGRMEEMEEGEGEGSEREGVERRHLDSHGRRSAGRLSFYQRAVSATAAASEASAPHHPTGIGRGVGSHRSAEDGAGEDGGRFVFLTPRVLTASGTLGWGGEGGVMVKGGGVHAFAASMSASLVV